MFLDTSNYSLSKRFWLKQISKNKNNNNKNIVILAYNIELVVNNNNLLY